MLKMLSIRERGPALAGELQEMVDDLSVVLTAPVLRETESAAQARAVRRKAQEDCNSIKAECEPILRRYSAAPSERWPLEAHAATKRIADAEAALAVASRAKASAVDRERAAFRQAASEKLAAAAPALAEVVRLLNEAITPLAELHLHAVRHGFHDMPALLAMVPRVQEATREVTASVNRYVPHGNAS